MPSAQRPSPVKSIFSFFSPYQCSSHLIRYDGCQEVTRLQPSSKHRNLRNLPKQLPQISAQTISRFIRPTSVEILKPIPTIGVPKNSATMAPIKARVELILSALKINGIAAGSFSFNSFANSQMRMYQINRVPLHWPHLALKAY